MAHTRIELATGQLLGTETVVAVDDVTGLTETHHLHNFVAADSLDPSVVSRVMTQEPTEDGAGLVTRGVYERESLNHLKSIDLNLRRGLAALLLLLELVAPPGRTPGPDDFDELARQFQ